MTKKDAAEYGQNTHIVKHFLFPWHIFREGHYAAPLKGEGYVGEKACYGRCYLALHYTKEDEELHFMSHREYVYVKYGLLAYYA